MILFKKYNIDTFFMTLSLLIISAGLLVFLSSVLSILADNEVQFWKMIINQIILGFGGGILMLYSIQKIKWGYIKKYSLLIFILSAILTALVFVPGIGFKHGGATRWISLGFISFQPSETMKIGVIMFLAHMYSKFNRKIHTVENGIVPIAITTVISGLIILMQPDFGTFLIVLLSSLSVYFFAGATWKHLSSMLAVMLVSFALLVAVRPYMWDRIITFIDPSSNGHSISYQIKQSLITLGSGGTFGRGYGQSIQKFSHLPEPLGDSIFAVIGEETGFVGALALVTLYVLFIIRGIWVSARVNDVYARFLIVGMTAVIGFQALINMGAMLSIIPLTGVTLPFVSQGGTSLLVSFTVLGLIIRASRE